MERIERPAPIVAPAGEKNGTGALPFGLNGTARPEIVGIAAGPSASRISPAAVAFAAARKIGAETLGRLGVKSGTVFFPDLGRKTEALFFPYRGGWKARSIEEKAHVSNKGLELQFWNLGPVLNAAKIDDVVIVEGELDACAMVESGVPADKVLSVPNGAKERTVDEPLRGYGYVSEALRAGLSKAKRFIWCGDSDGPGRSLREDMVRLLGEARFWFVEWPEGCKDANDYLISDGPVALHELITDGALPWPVNGVYRLGELPEPPPLTLWRPGFAEWESKVHLAPRTVSLTTGHPGHGKTALCGQIWFQVCQRYGVPICVASFETRAKPHLRRQLRTLLTGRLERDLSESETKAADLWINDRYFFIVHPEQRPTLEWFMDMAEVAVVRHGARVVQLDPWNRLEAARGKDESETEYIARCLRNLYVFANQMNCHIQIVAHPAKMDGPRRGQPPGLEDVAGSKHWENMVDQGFVIHRPQIYDGVNRRTEAVLFHKKARFDELGYPCKLGMNYLLDQGRYVSTDYELRQ